MNEKKEASTRPVFLTIREIEKILKRRLSTGWVVITGDVEAISQLENAYFTPGTPANADFELLSLPLSPGLEYLFLARKQRLKPMKMTDLERTLELHCVNIDESSTAIQQTFARDGEPERVNTYVKKLLERAQTGA